MLSIDIEYRSLVRQAETHSTLGLTMVNILPGGEAERVAEAEQVPVDGGQVAVRELRPGAEGGGLSGEGEEGLEEHRCSVGAGRWWCSGLKPQL